jgi:hypothetical protein
MTLLLRDAEVDNERTVIRADVRPVAVGGNDHPAADEAIVERHSEQ